MLSIAKLLQKKSTETKAKILIFCEKCTYGNALSSLNFAPTDLKFSSICCKRMSPRELLSGNQDSPIFTVCTENPL